MSSPRLERAVAGGLAGWAAARLAAADRAGPLEAAAVPLMSFTPQAAAAAWLAALLMRDRSASTTAALAGAVLTALVVPRALPRRQPPATGPVLRVLTANLLAGRALAEPVVDLVRETGADVLFLQELSGDAATRLKRAGLHELLPNEVTDVLADGPRGNAIYARYPLSDGPAVAATSAGQPAARLDLPSGQSVRLICVHTTPPTPRWYRRAVPRWRGELSALPPPGDPPVILAGDFNATLDHAQLRRLLRLGHRDAASQNGSGLLPTWGPEPRGRPPLLTIDHVLIDPRCAVRASFVRRLPGSDHRAVYAEFRLPASAGLPRPG